jgi:light-regulated signal transduction histidine kinase (bacteriophytochrome)
MKNQEKNDVPEGSEAGEVCAHDFVFIAAHDLREPLRAIRASSELLAGMRGAASAEDAARCYRFIQEGVDRAEALIHDIAEYCSLETRELDLASMEMNSALAEAAKELSEEFRSNGAVLTQDPLPAVIGDFPALTAVLRNLMANACKFRSASAPKIHVGAARQGSEWVISVGDNGLGFNPAYRDRVFRPFEKLNGKQYPGSGLGLTLAKRVVERHGGRMWAESQIGEGSVFRFTLPTSQSAEPPGTPVRGPGPKGRAS